MESDKGLFRGSNWIGCSTVWSQWTIWWYSNSILSSPNIPKSHHMLLSWHTFIPMQFQMFVYFLPFEAYFNYICVFDLVYWSGIDSFHIDYLPILLIRKKTCVKLVPSWPGPPQKSSISTPDFGSRRFNLIVQRNPMQRTRSTAAQGIGEPLLMEEIPHRLISKHPSILQGFIHVRWCRTSSINRMIRFTQKIFSRNLSVKFVPSKHHLETRTLTPKRRV